MLLNVNLHVAVLLPIHRDLTLCYGCLLLVRIGWHGQDGGKRAKRLLWARIVAPSACRGALSILDSLGAWVDLYLDVVVTPIPVVV